MICLSISPGPDGDSPSEMESSADIRVDSVSLASLLAILIFLIFLFFLFFDACFSPYYSDLSHFSFFLIF